MQTFNLKSAQPGFPGSKIKNFFSLPCRNAYYLERKTSKNRETVIAAKPRRRRDGGGEEGMERDYICVCVYVCVCELCRGYAKADDGATPGF